MTAVGALDRWLWRSRQPIAMTRQIRIVETPLAAIRVRDTANPDGCSGNDPRDDSYDNSRPALVFLCDPPITVEHYDDLIAGFAADYRVVIVELPGFGQSRLHAGAGLEFADSVAMVESALVQMALGPIVLCGPCIAGFVATELAKRAALEIAGLVLIQSPDLAGMRAWTERMDPKRRLRIPFIGQLLVRLSARKIARFWLRYATAKGFDSSAMIGRANDVFTKGGAYPLATLLQRWTTGPDNHGLTLPCLLLWGQQDRSHAATDRQCSRRHAPKGQLVVLSDCGHFPELEAPAQFAEAVAPFISDCHRKTGN